MGEVEVRGRGGKGVEEDVEEEEGGGGGGRDWGMGRRLQCVEESNSSITAAGFTTGFTTDTGAVPPASVAVAVAVAAVLVATNLGFSPLLRIASSSSPFPFSSPFSLPFSFLLPFPFLLPPFTSLA